MNIIFSGFLHPLIGILSGLALIFGSEFFGKFLLRKNKYNFFFLNLSTGLILISAIAYIFVLLGQFKYINIIIAYFVTFLGIYNFFYFFKRFQLKTLDIKVNFYFFLIIIILLFLFFISISAPTMADSLKYHLGVANYILNYHHIPSFYISDNFSLYGLGEVYNFLGLIVYSDIVGSLIQFIGLVSFLHFFSKVIIDKSKYIFFCFFILGSPVLVFLISGAKFLLFPQLITTLILYLLIITKKFDFKSSIFLLFLIFGVANFKLNFFLTGAVLGFFLLFKTTINIKFLISGFILFIFFFLPKSIYNFFTLEDFYYFNFITSSSREFLDALKIFRENNLLFPLNLFLTFSIGQINTILGFQLLLFFFIKKMTKINIIIFIVTFIAGTLYFFIGQSTGRIYHELVLWLSLNIIFIKSYRVNINYISGFFIINIIPVLIISALGFFILSPSIINNEYRQDVMRRSSFEYKGIEWVNQNTLSTDTIFTDLSSSSLFNSKVMHNNSYINVNKYYNFLREQEINYIVILNFDIKKNYFFKNCDLSLIKQSPKYVVERRNLVNKDHYYSVSILKVKNKSLKNCI